MKTSFCRWLTLVATSCVSALLLTSSCGRQPIQTIDDTNTDTVTVTGAFADWTPATSPFAGGTFLLLDSSTNEVFRSEKISLNKFSFEIKNVPISGKYYGFLIGADYQALAFIQKTESEDKAFRVFKFGNSAGQLGTIVIKGQTLLPSQLTDLDFQTAYVSKSSETEYLGKFSTTFVPNPDLDGDGIPNIIDTDLNGRDGTNGVDSKTYSDKDNSEVPWQYNYGNGIPKQGFFRCDHNVAPNPDYSSPSIKFSCFLKLNKESVASIKISSANLNSETAMRDDGDLNFNDALANDGIWSASFVLENKNVPYKNQLVMANVILKTGETKSYITTLGPQFPYEIKIDSTDFKIDTQGTPTKLTLTYTITHPKSPKAPDPSDRFKVEAIFYKNDGSTLCDDANPVCTISGVYKADKGKTPWELEDTSLKFDPSNPKFKIKLRLIGPAAGPGLTGSAVESAVQEVSASP